MEHTLGRGVDYVVECAGFADQTIERLDRCLAVNSSIIDIGMGGANPTVPIVAYKRMGVQYAGSLGHAGGPFPARNQHDGGWTHRHAQDGQRPAAAG